jgi:hypothetical protein
MSGWHRGRRGLGRSGGHRRTYPRGRRERQLSCSSELPWRLRRLPHRAVLDQATRAILKFDFLAERTGSDRHLLVSGGDSVQISGRRGTIQRFDCRVKAFPQELWPAATALRTQLVRRFTACGAMSRPLVSGVVRPPAYLGFVLRCVRQLLQACAEASVGRSEPMGAKRSDPVMLSSLECRLDLIVLAVCSPLATDAHNSYLIIVLLIWLLANAESCTY